MPDLSFRELGQTHYFQEFERKRELNSNLTIVIGVIGLISASLIAMMQNLRPPLSNLEISLMAGLLGSSVAVGFSIYQAIRSFVGHSYRYIAPMSEIIKWRKKAEQAGYKNDELDRATVQMICDQYIAAIETNDRVNDVKSARVHRASQGAVAAIALAIVSAVPWALIELSSPAMQETGTRQANDVER